MRRALAVVAALAAIGCESGPKQIFTPQKGDLPTLNGYNPKPPYFQDGTKDFDSTAGKGDSVERARFCDQAENDEVVQKMVIRPITPDTQLGGVPLWTKDGRPVHADDLIGRPEDGKFCDPDVYSNALVWGPTYEVIAFINEETRLIESVVATQAYLGQLEGTFKASNGSDVKVIFKPNERVDLGGRELSEFASAAEQATKPNSWLNHKNISDMYRAIRQTHFGAAPIPDSFDCVANKLCDIIYTSNAGGEYDTAIVFQDSGVVLAFTPTGELEAIQLDPVRVAPFEVSTSLDLNGATGFSPTFMSASKASCSISLDAQLTWDQFRERCVDSTDSRTLARATYDVHGQRDAVNVNFNGVTMTFKRRIAQGEVMRDGENPGTSDILYGISFTRSLSAPVEEFRPLDLGAKYKAKLEKRLATTFNGTALATWTLTVPTTLSADPQPIGELFAGTRSWLPSVIAQVQAEYEKLPADQKLKAEKAKDPLFLIEPFVDAVLESFSGGASDLPTSFKGFRTTDDRRWSIGFASFVRNGVPYRLNVQYSMNYSALTAVFLERGSSQIDEIFELRNKVLRPTAPYYNIDLSLSMDSLLGLNGAGVTVGRYDATLGTVDVSVRTGAKDTAGQEIISRLTVPGDTIDNRSGYSRQLGGERYEFVPANLVTLNGKETYISLYVEADGKVGRVSQALFKNKLTLCDGPTPLQISYGDNVPEALASWSAVVGPDVYRACDVVFNYSENGNVLTSVVSIKRKTSLSTIDNRAVTAAIWR